MKEIPETFEQAVGYLESKLTQKEKQELKKLAFISINSKDETDFFELVISLFKLDEENNNLLRDIAKQKPGAVLNDDYS